MRGQVAPAVALRSLCFLLSLGGIQPLAAAQEEGGELDHPQRWHFATSLLPIVTPEAITDHEDLEAWAERVREVAANAPPYPFENHEMKKERGIVMTTGKRTYFTAAYVTLRVLREHLRSRLPVELFYAGPEEMPQVAIDYLQTTWEGVRVVDASSLPGLQGVDLKGYQIKATAVYHSRFQEVLWLDSDNMPLEDPASLFESKLYRENGAVLWPDVCNMISLRSETFGVFGQTAPQPYPQPRPGKRTIWPMQCYDNVPREIESGQMLINKERVWKALYMSYYLNVNHKFFLQRLFHGDKMTFHFAFVAAGQEYGRVPFEPASVGVATPMTVGGKKKTVFCGNTLAQKHPDEDRAIFLHRNSAKFKDASSFFVGQVTPRLVWRHMATAKPGNSWNLVFRGELGEEFFAGKDSSTHNECLRPTKAKVVVAPKIVKDLETAALGYLRDLRDVPFYPGHRKCNTENIFFCKNP